MPRGLREAEDAAQALPQIRIVVVREEPFYHLICCRRTVGKGGNARTILEIEINSVGKQLGHSRTRRPNGWIADGPIGSPVTALGCMVHFSFFGTSLALAPAYTTLHQKTA